MRFVNLTPHEINPVGQGALPPSGQVARVKMESREVAPGFFLQSPGPVEGLPEPQVGVLLVASALVRSAVPHRGDVVSPGELVRNESGQPIGCNGFSVNPGFYDFWVDSNP